MLSPEVGPAIRADRTAAELYGQRDLIAQGARNAAKQVKEGLAAKGREVGEAMGRAVQQVAGPTPGPFIEFEANDGQGSPLQHPEQDRKAPQRPQTPECRRRQGLP